MSVSRVLFIGAQTGTIVDVVVGIAEKLSWRAHGGSGVVLRTW